MHGGVRYLQQGNVSLVMEALKERDGTPFNVQANKALREWLERKGVLKKASKN